MTSLGVAWLIRRSGVPNGYSMVSSYQVPTSLKYYSTPTSFLACIGVTWLIRHRGVPNGYSTVSSYQVPTSSKYYSMPTSFLASIGFSSRMWRMGVQILILRGFITKCQVVGNIIRRQRVFWRVLAFLRICGV